MYNITVKWGNLSEKYYKIHLIMRIDNFQIEIFVRKSSLYTLFCTRVLYACTLKFQNSYSIYPIRQAQKLGPIGQNIQNTDFLKVETILTGPTFISPCLTFCIYCVKAQSKYIVSDDSTHIWFEAALIVGS